MTTTRAPRPIIAVVGAGVVGMASALLLTEAGYTVKIVARDLPGDSGTEWASPWAGALLAPFPEGDAAMQEESLRHYARLAATEPWCGVRTLPITEYYDDHTTDGMIWFRHLFPDFRWLAQSQLPGHAKLGFSYTGKVVNPTFFLPWLSAKLTGLGVTFTRATVSSLAEAVQLTGAAVVVNASGNGARVLAGDEGAVPVRGQTMFVRKSGFDRAVMYQGSEYTYAIPRTFSGGVIIGGVKGEGSTDAKVDKDTKRDILRRINAITDGSFADVDLERDVQDIVGFRPGRKAGVRVEREGDVVHAYGAGGLGYLYAFGIATKVRSLVQARAKI
ncbi:uncharacterized protein K452DRAFT_299160 [Aplosporella prunicola CBS 121167]|uniref:FAD dependent oxidoreductase domain-containing protein n=1 Tax=Aplosporella prunicola CBS 121167 TaxID=1176127 RepID=A0A6A6BBY5_9PEZI|nr:uncharacterized protein K452DRAFT_299160 [Aplosporella prunicola CBS 121167]KAF2141118.1 hypothetical protein K452DRAFT_299160 [Aplosporella prunicola CBS 121167]